MSEQDFNSLLNIIERINENLGRLNAEFITLNNRINDLEVKVDNLRVQYDSHDHPYKSPPVYGRGSM